MFGRECLDIQNLIRYNMTIFDEEGFCVSYRFREAREKAGLSAAEVGRRIGVSQPAVTQWETGSKVPSVEMLCKLADLYCVPTDYLLGRDIPVESIHRAKEYLSGALSASLNLGKGSGPLDHMYRI